MNRAGVTLVELVIGLTIASAVLTAGYGALTTTLDRRELAVDAIEADLRAAATRTSLRTWLSAARVSPQSTAPSFSGANGRYDDLPDDQLSFLTSAATPVGRGVATVTLSIDRDPDTTEQGLVADFAAWPGGHRTRLELVPKALGLEVRYRSGLLFGRSWHPSWISSTVMPAGIELRLVGPPEGLHPLLAFRFRIALEGGR